MTATAGRPRAFAVRWSEMDRWVAPLQVIGGSLPPGWAWTPIGDVVRQIEERARLEPTREYDLMGVRWYGEGVFHRETVRGEESSASYLTPLVPSALIYNRLFAWKAAFAVVPQELAGGFVSNEFPQFEVDSARALPEYLYLFFTSEHTLRAVNRASSGSAAVSRNRFKEGEFLGFRIPLPPLPEQRAIVERWRATQAEVAAARESAERTEEEAQQSVARALGIRRHGPISIPKAFAVSWHDLERWSSSYLARTEAGTAALQESSYPLAELGDIAQVSYGIAKSPRNRPGANARPYLRVANVQRGQLDLSELKRIEVSPEEFQSFQLLPDDLLVCEGNSAELVGRPAIWKGQVEGCVHQNHILRVRVDRERVLPDFLLEYMQLDPARQHFRARAKFTTNLASINSSDLRELPVTLPPLSVQHALVERVHAMRAEAAREREAADRLEREGRAEVEEMIRGTRSVSTS